MCGMRHIRKKMAPKGKERGPRDQRERSDWLRRDIGGAH